MAEATIRFEQLILGWSKLTLEGKDGHGPIARSPQWPASLTTLESLRGFSGYLRQGDGGRGQSQDDYPLGLFWTRSPDPRWFLFGCKRNLARDGEGRRGAYLVHLLAHPGWPLNLSWRLNQWDRPFLRHITPDTEGRRDLLSVDLTDAHDSPQTPRWTSSQEDQRLLLAYVITALQNQLPMFFESSAPEMSRGFLGWLSEVIPVPELNGLRMSLFENSAAENPRFDVVFLDPTFSAHAGTGMRRLMNLEDPGASAGARGLSSTALEVADGLLNPSARASLPRADLASLVLFVRAESRTRRPLHPSRTEPVDQVVEAYKLSGRQVPAEVSGVIALSLLDDSPHLRGARETLLALAEAGGVERPKDEGDVFPQLILGGLRSDDSTWQFCQRLLRSFEVKPQALAKFALGALRTGDATPEDIPPERLQNLLQASGLTLSGQDFAVVFSNKTYEKYFLAADPSLVEAALAAACHEEDTLLLFPVLHAIARREGSFSVAAQRIDDLACEDLKFEVLRRGPEAAVDLARGFTWPVGAFNRYLDAHSLTETEFRALVGCFIPDRLDVLGLHPTVAPVLREELSRGWIARLTGRRSRKVTSRTDRPRVSRGLRSRGARGR